MGQGGWGVNPALTRGAGAGTMREGAKGTMAGEEILTGGTRFFLPGGGNKVK